MSDTIRNNDMSEEIKQPELCQNCKPLVESSKLEWVKVGGMSVGLHRQPLQWVLRDKYSSDTLNMNAKYSQQLAAKSRELAAITKERDRLEREVEILRLYGNKDCTRMADERLKELQSTNSTTP